MGFEVPPSRVGPSRMGRAGAVIAGAIAAVVVIALAAQPHRTTTGQDAVATTPGVESPAAAVIGSAPAPVATPLPTRMMPVALRCRDVDDVTCRGMAQAALMALDDSEPAVTGVTVYHSLLCDDDLACPPTRLASATQPWGSVVVDLVGVPAAWVDVVTRADTTMSSGPASPAAAAPWEAWIVR